MFYNNIHIAMDSGNCMCKLNATYTIGVVYHIVTTPKQRQINVIKSTPNSSLLHGSNAYHN